MNPKRAPAIKKIVKKIPAIFVKGIRGTDEILLDDFPQFALVGRSNVGKSSLINVLTRQRELAREGKRPGKTREINFYLVQNRMYLVDLPGYGFAEAAGVERKKLKNLIVWYLTDSQVAITVVALIIDAVAGLTELDEQMLTILKAEEQSFVIVMNKVDKLNQKELSAQMIKVKELAGDQELFLVSTKTGKGIDSLRERLFGSIN